ncbi:MAG: hypothetical protein GC137_07040 [Alphaproteobacteria bacterium]|nr:hypothetical protein [Alphaproteobacteria bacterium]
MLVSKFLRIALLVVFFNTAFVFSFAQNAYACCIFGCTSNDCSNATQFISDAHEDIRERIKTEFDDDLDQFEEWMITYFFEGSDAPSGEENQAGVIQGVGAMLNQMGGAAMQFTAAIGGFLDAQLHIETLQLMRKMQFDAHKAYRPSPEFCAFGTNVKSLAGSDSIGEFNELALGRIALQRQLGTVDMAGATSRQEDYKSRWGQFKRYYCDAYDNNRLSSNTGLELLCPNVTDANRVNRDIDYTRLIDEPRALVLDFADTTLDITSEPEATLMSGLTEQPGDEEDIMALSKNLYGHKIFRRDLSLKQMSNEDVQKIFLALRSVAAKRSVAQASFNAIVGLKSAGVSHEQTDPYIHPSNAFGLNVSLSNISLLSKQVRFFMTSGMQELLPASGALGFLDLGINILDMIGYSPSYFSQLEFLSKRMYQTPNFYAQLYDSPANVLRKKVAMQAIEVMVDREMYESQIRREMLVSVLLSSKLRASYLEANRGLIATPGGN